MNKFCATWFGWLPVSRVIGEFTPRGGLLESHGDLEQKRGQDSDNHNQNWTALVQEIRDRVRARYPGPTL